MGPVVDEKQFETVLEAIEAAKKEGAKLVLRRRARRQRRPTAGYFIAPTVFDNVKPDMKLAREEVFGPVLAIIPVDDFEEAIQVANDVEYGLSSSIYTNDIQRVMQYADASKPECST